MKVLPSGIYHFRFIVDGQWRYAPDFPHECDDTGRVFNVLDLKVLPCEPFLLFNMHQKLYFLSAKLFYLRLFIFFPFSYIEFVIVCHRELGYDHSLVQKLHIGFGRTLLWSLINVTSSQDVVPEVLNNIHWPESPPSPASSYNSEPFSSRDFNEKLPDLPPLLQQTPLNQPSSSRDGVETLEKPLPAVLNHLYFQKGHTGQSLVALTSTHRFRSKYVSLVLFKSLKDLKR